MARLQNLWTCIHWVSARCATTLAVGLAAMCLASPGLAQTIERMKLTDGELHCTQLYAEVQQMDTAIQLAAPPPGAMALPAAGAAALPANPAPVGADGGGLAGMFGGLLGGGNVGAPGAALPPGAVGAMAGLAPNQQGIPAAALTDPSVQRAVARARAAGYSDAQINAAMQLGAARAGYPVGAAVAAAPAAQSAASPVGGLFGALAGGRGVGGGVAGGVAAAGGLFGALAQSAAAQPTAQASAQNVTQNTPVLGAVHGLSATSGSSLAAQAQARKEHLTSLFLKKGCKLADVQK
jgi:hypothetical protein